MDPWDPKTNPSAGQPAPGVPASKSAPPPPMLPSAPPPNAQLPSAPAPTYVQPAPTYVQPAPIYAQPEPVTYPIQIAPVKPAKKGSGVLNVLLGLGLVIAVGGIAFAAGRLTAPASAATANGGNGGNGGFGRFGTNPNASFPPGAAGGGAGLFGRGAGGLAIQGTVTAVTADGITLQLTGGQSITVGTDSSTTYQTAAAGTATDAAVGSDVLVQLDTTSGGFGAGGGGFGGGGFGRNPNGGSAATPPPPVGASPAPAASHAPVASGAPGVPATLGSAKTVIVLPK
jgi:hypothetical protein